MGEWKLQEKIVPKKVRDDPFYGFVSVGIQDDGEGFQQVTDSDAKRS